MSVLESGVPVAPVGLTHEDTVRSGDRSRVVHARRRGRRWSLAWLLVGPGILAMLGENDGPSMISYATTGATYGLGFFVPFIAVTFAMAVVCQEMCMRVGAVTHRGYGELVLQRYGKVWGWFSAGDLAFTNLVTLIAEFVAIRVGMAYFHLGAPVAELDGEPLVSPAEPRPHRSGRHLELDGDLPGCEPEHVMEDDGVLLVPREPPDSREDLERVGNRLRHRLDPGRRVGPLQSRAAEAARCQVAQNGAAPRVGMRVARNLRPVLPSPDERLLGEIVGLLGVAGVDERDATQHRLGFAEEPLIALDRPARVQVFSSARRFTQG